MSGPGIRKQGDTCEASLSYMGKGWSFQEAISRAQKGRGRFP